MKWKTLILPACGCLFFSSCDQLKQPLSGDFNPLSAPGSRRGSASSQAQDVTPSPTYSKGQFVYAISSSTAFFKTKPSGNADADRLLPTGTSMRIASTGSSYLKVELDNGEVGYVPTVMVSDSKTGNGSSGAVQVSPPIHANDALPLPGQGNVTPDVNLNSTPVPPIDMTPLPPIDIPPVPETSSPTTPAPIVPATPSTPEMKKSTAADTLPPSSVPQAEQVPQMSSGTPSSTSATPPSDALPTPAAEKTKEQLEKEAKEKLQKAAQ